MSGAGTGINPFCRVRFSGALWASSDGAAAPSTGSAPRGPRPISKPSIDPYVGHDASRGVDEPAAGAHHGKSRTAIYNALTDIIEEEALEEMLTNFPAREIDEPVTRDFLTAQLSLAEGRLSGDTHKLRNEMSERFASQTRWMAGMVVAIPSVTVALQAYFG